MRLDDDPLITEPPALSPDLEWMLQSSQASPVMLAEALVREYYAPVYRLAISILDDERAARQAAQGVIGQALKDAHLYREGMGVRNWLYCLAMIHLQRNFKQLRLKRRLKASLPLPKRPADLGVSVPPSQVDAILWLEVDSLEEHIRLPLLLDIVHAWSIPDIALILGLDEGEVRIQLEAARSIIAEGLGREGFPVDDLEGEKLDALLKRSLGERWPSVSLSDEDQGDLVAAILKKSGMQGNRGPLISSLRDFLLISLVLVVMGSLVWIWNRSLPKSVEPVQIQSTPTISSNEQGLGSIPSAKTYQRLYVVKPGDTLPSISARTGTSVDELKRMNYLGDDEALEPGRVLVVSFWLPTSPATTPTPVIPVAPVSAPLTEKATSQEIYQRLASSSSNWHTLWADVQLINYGPEGYVGPPHPLRVQVWISQPGQSLELYGSLDGLVESEYLNTGGLNYSANKYQDFVSVFDAPSSSVTFGNNNLFFPGLTSWLEEGTLHIMGSSQVAGRSVLIIDRLDPDGKRAQRLWIDTRTGVLLRLKRYGEHDDTVVLSDYLVTAISFDVDFPQEVFDPGRMLVQRFAQDYNAQPEAGESGTTSAWAFPDSRPRLERLSPPTLFDASLRPLTFQYPPGPPVSGWHDAGPQAVELFAGEFYLGSLRMAYPWFYPCTCTRSPDGSQIAYISDANSGDLYWIDLSHPEEIHGPPEYLNASDLAFAPDNQTLAVDGAGFKFGQWVRGIFILDTGSGDYQLLLQMEYASSLVWSPDGAYLALIGEELASSTYEAMIFQIDTGRIIYRIPVDMFNIPSETDPNWPAPDWPARNWGVEFPNYNRDLGSCSFTHE
jgi:DNA-directed RNA polymerase specialized sigma24 family protein/LysM repeat protein